MNGGEGRMKGSAAGGREGEGEGRRIDERER